MPNNEQIILELDSKIAEMELEVQRLRLIKREVSELEADLYALFRIKKLFMEDSNAST